MIPLCLVALIKLSLIDTNWGLTLFLAERGALPVSVLIWWRRCLHSFVPFWSLALNCLRDSSFVTRVVGSSFAWNRFRRGKVCSISRPSLAAFYLLSESNQVGPFVCAPTCDRALLALSGVIPLPVRLHGGHFVRILGLVNRRVCGVTCLG